MDIKEQMVIKQYWKAEIVFFNGWYSIYIYSDIKYLDAGESNNVLLLVDYTDSKIFTIIFKYVSYFEFLNILLDS